MEGDGVNRKLDHVPYWLYLVILAAVGTACFLLGRWS